MKILVENGCYELRNMGDVAMLQVAVKRLHELWPDALIQIITDEPELLGVYCPHGLPVPAVGRHIWFQDRNVLGDFYRFIPDRIARCFVSCGRWARYNRPN
jgi:colanic acid/amylovoran biosynthesis protein